MVKISGLFSPMSLLFTNLSMALVLVFGGKLTILNTISIGDFVAFNSYSTPSRLAHDGPGLGDKPVSTGLGFLGSNSRNSKHRS